MTALSEEKPETAISSHSKRNFVAFVAVAFFLILPMFVIKNITFDSTTQVRDGAAAATAAIGAIFRSNSRTLLRSTLMSAIRTSLRAVTRRVVRSFLPIVVRLFLPALQSAAHRKEPEQTETAWVMPLILGCVTLGFSFAGVVVWGGGAENEELLYGFSVMVSGIMAASALDACGPYFGSVGTICSHSRFKRPLTGSCCRPTLRGRLLSALVLRHYARGRQRSGRQMP